MALSRRNHKFSPILISMLHYQIPPNIQVNWLIKFFRTKHKQQFGDKVQDCEGGSSPLQSIKFADFVTCGQEIKLVILVKF